MDVRFRRAQREDLPALVALLNEDSRAPGPSWETDSARYVVAFDAIAASPADELWVADLGGEVVGCLQLTVIPGLSKGGATRGLIEAVRIRADLRSRGFGERLMRAALQRCRERGCSLVQLTSDRTRPEAHRFYERLGFVASHVGMKRRLD